MFENPWALALLLLIIPFWIFKKRSRGGIGYSDVAIPKAIIAAQNPILVWVRANLTRILRTVFVLCAVLALAKPNTDMKKNKLDVEGIDIGMVIDTSGSMRALDMTWNDEAVDRLTVVKNVIGKFIDERPSDRIGLVVFGNAAFTQAPLTLDHKVLVDLLNYISIGMIGDSTAIGDGLAVAVSRVKDSPNKSKVIILLTDGENTAGDIDPMEAANAAKAFGLRVYTIGVGKEGEVPMPTVGFFGQATIDYVQSSIDEGLLKRISETTGGKFYRAQDTASLQKIYSEIDQLEKAKLTQDQSAPALQIHEGWLAASILMLFAEVAFALTRWRRIP